MTLTLSHTLDGFALSYQPLPVLLGKELLIELAVRATPRQARPNSEEALHTGISAVSDVERVAVAGLEGSAFIDKTANLRRRPAAGAPLSLAKETDSVYLDTPATLTLDDPGLGRRIAHRQDRRRLDHRLEPMARESRGDGRSRRR